MEFDNEISILLKQARELRTPAKYVLDGKNVILEISELIPTGISLADLYIKYPSLNPQDLGMLYARTEKAALPKKTILDNINQFYETLEISPIRDVLELDLLLTEWENNYISQFQFDMQKLENIEIIQEELFKYEPLSHSPLEITSTIVFSTMTSKGKIPKVEDGFEIFDLSQPNTALPFIRWNTNLEENKEMFKLYTGKSLEDRLDYSKVIPTLGSKESINSFGFSVWNGDFEKDNIKEATKESFLKGVYDLENNRLKIKIPLDKKENEVDKIFNRITDVFPLESETLSQTSIAGEVFVFDVDVNDLLFSHMVLNYELMNNYLFMKEMSSSFAMKKKQLKLYFRSASSIEDPTAPSSVAFSINQNYSKGGEVVSIIDPKTKKVNTIRLNPDTPYIRLKISSADSLEVAESFLKIFTRLLTYYKSNKDELEMLYLTYIPNFKLLEEEENFLLTKTTKKAGRDTADTKISRLKQAAPDLFIRDYARKCLCPFQPIVISDDEIEAWKAKTFIHEDEELERQILQFPPDNPKWNFVCPDDNYPFPGVKKNALPNKDVYKGLPCCFVNDQMSENVNSKYNKIYRQGEEEEEVKKVEFHMIKTDKILTPGRYGSLPSSIVDLLKIYSKKEKEIRRKGVPRSVNSLIHCISIAAKDPKYIEKNEVEREQYVSALRTAITRTTLPGLLKQEMYDFNDFEITSFLKDNSSFLDPNLAYRALEEAYKINVFVFAPSEDEEKRLRNKEDSVGIIQFPRFKLFHSRSPNPDRPSVIIYRTLGSESDDLAYPQCELIVSVSETSEGTIKEENIFQKEMFSIIFDAMLSVKSTITWELVSAVLENQIDILARENIYSRISYYEMTNKIADKQFIDEYGKCRGLYLPVKGEEILMVTPPCQPENLPSFSSITRASYSTVKSFISEPVALTEKNNMIDGLWYSVLDLVYGIYIPIKPILRPNELKDLPIGAPNPLGEKGKEVVPRIRKLKRDLDFILQIIKWLYAISKMNLPDFLNSYIGIGDIKGDSAKIYDFSKIGRTFPEVETVKEGIEEMRKRVPSLFVGDRLLLYSDKFFNGIHYLMKMYVKEYRSQIPKAITRKHLTEQDFISHFEVALFLSEKDLKTWLTSFDKYTTIHSTVNVASSLNNEPYLYMAPDKHIYLIQNVIEGNFKRALFVCDLWEKNKVNVGFLSPEIEEEVPYVIYGISSANTAIPIENNAKDSLTFYSILQYNSISYAAMLLLL